MVILIDNDILIHLGWQAKAAKVGVKLKTFTSIQDFLMQVDPKESDITIYIDSDLGNGIRGENEAKTLYDLGYKTIFLATGYVDFKIQDYPWIKGVFPKAPPF